MFRQSRTTRRYIWWTSIALLLAWAVYTAEPEQPTPAAQVAACFRRAGEDAEQQRACREMETRLGMDPSPRPEGQP